MASDPTGGDGRGGTAVRVLRCEYEPAPLGVETPRPRLSWELESDRRGARQTAVRLLVASSPEILAADTGDVWDSGRVESAESAHVEYAGPRLKSRQRCWWKVGVWDETGTFSGFSQAAWWEMGLLRPGDWKAKWITGAPADGPLGPDDGATAAPAPMLRRAFTLKGAARAARVYVSGLGYHDLYINGRRVGDHRLDPAFTRYDRRVLYVTHDVTELLRPGENVVGVILGTGWYDAHTVEVWDFHKAPWRDRPKLLLQLEAEGSGGRRTTLVSDPSWQTSTGPIVFDGLRNGETYDARRVRKGWSEPGYDASGWQPARLVPGPGGELHSQQLPPVRVHESLKPARLSQPAPGVVVYDMGRSLSGWAQVRVSGPAGTTLTLRYAERLKPNGEIDAGHISCFVKSGAFQTDTYILNGEAVEIWEPRFTYHGFRYVQVTGLPGTPSLEHLRAQVAHTDLGRRGEFSCSSRLLNEIQALTLQATVSNYHHIPTDCPHREKNGWTGDAHLSAEQVLLNHAPMTAYAKWMADFRDAQRPSGQLPGIVPTGGWGYNWGSGPAWDSACILIPWYTYLYAGDRRILEDNYAMMTRYLEFLGTLADRDGIVAFGLGDWCPPVGGAGDHACPTALTSTAYYYADADTVARIAEILGRSADARRLRRLAAAVKAAFRRRFLDAGTGRLASASQTAQACALYQGLVEGPDERARVLAVLLTEVAAKNGHLDCGILGAKYLLHALTACGRTDVAARIVQQTTFPGWGHWIAQGATTLWESWDGGTSRIHHMFSDVSAWFYRGLAGLNPDPDAPGFRHFIVRPGVVPGIEWARAEHRSLYGLIECGWAVEEGTLRVTVTVPPNCTATVHVPTADAAGVEESHGPAERAAGVRRVAAGAGEAVFEVAAGRYVFTAPR